MDLAGHHLSDPRSRPDLADLTDNMLVFTPDLHQEFHSWRPGTCTPNDFQTFAETVPADLFDPVNTRQMQRLQTLTRGLRRLEQERKGQQVRYQRN